MCFKLKNRCKMRMFVMAVIVIMIFSTLSLTAEAKAEDYYMFLGYAGDRVEKYDWNYNFSGEDEINTSDIIATTARIRSGDTVTIGLKFPEKVIYTWYVAPVIVAEGVTSLSYTINSVTIDGKEMLDTIDLTLGEEEWWYEATGNYTSEQAIRLKGGYNEWLEKYITESPKDFTEIMYTITVNDITIGGEKPENSENDFDPNGTYHAYLGLTTPTWIFRGAWNDVTYGKDSGCFDQLGFISADGWKAQGGIFEDVEITGNGTYTVEVKDYDFSGVFEELPILGHEGTFYMLFVSTDLPVCDDVVISNVVLRMDGKEIITHESAFLDEDSKEVQKIVLANIWNDEIPELPYYPAPKQSIKISFDVNGFANDIVVNPEEQVRAFVERMYTVALDRASDPSGIEYWSKQLLTHQVDGAKLSEGFILSEEFAEKNYSDAEYLKVLYKTFFNREADEGGIEHWMSQLGAGKSRRSVLAGFVNSTEFDELCTAYGIDRGTMAEDEPSGEVPAEGGVGQFVERLYTVCLERASEPAGLAEWTRRINAGESTPEEVAKFFFLSEEYVEKNTSNDKYIETLYLTFMDRASEVSGKAYWVERLNQGVSRATALEGFAQSPEFQEIMDRYGL